MRVRKIESLQTEGLKKIQLMSPSWNVRLVVRIWRARLWISSFCKNSKVLRRLDRNRVLYQHQGSSKLQWRTLMLEKPD